MLRPVLPLVEYVVYQDYIAEFLCVNSNKPELQCDGKCYLMQQITKQNEDKKQNLPQISMKEYPIGFVYIMRFVVQKKLSDTSQTTLVYRNNYHFMYSDSSFHPPNYYFKFFA